MVLCQADRESYGTHMAYEGQELQGRDGGRLRFVPVREDLLEMEARFSGVGPLPPLHLHPRQDEQFDVLEGRVRAVIVGHQRCYAAGQTFEVSAWHGSPNGRRRPERVNWQVRPALRSGEFAEAVYEGAVAADPEAFLARYADEIQLVAPPDDAQRSPQSRS